MMRNKEDGVETHRWVIPEPPDQTLPRKIGTADRTMSDHPHRMSLKPIRLLLDQDGPLAQFDIHFHAKCVEMGGIEFDCDGPHVQSERYFTDHIPNLRQRAHARKMIDTAGWFRELPVTPGAQEGVDRLLRAGIDIWVCTKPLEANPTCRDDKGAWLREHFPMLEDKLILAPDKSIIMGDILLDDAPKTEWLSTAPWEPVIFSVPFNGPGSEWDGIRHWSWEDSILDLISPKDYPRLQGRPFEWGETSIGAAARFVKEVPGRYSVHLSRDA